MFTTGAFEEERCQTILQNKGYCANYEVICFQEQPISRNTSERLPPEQFIYLSCQNMKMIAKRFSISSAGVLLEKVIRKNYEMFLHETSMRKPFFSKATCSSTKKEFIHIPFPSKFRKMSRKKHKNFQKNY